MPTRKKEESLAYKPLYKSRQDRLIDGVCGGIAEYLNVASTWIRLVWLTLVFFGGIGIVLYVIGMIAIPVNPEQKMTPKKTSVSPRRIVGVVLMGIGILALFKWISHSVNLDSISKFTLFHPFLGGAYFWKVVFFPLLLIFIGVLLVLRAIRPASSVQRIAVVSHKILRSRKNRWIAGVLGGFGEYWHVDPILLRFLYILLIGIVGFGFALLLYVACIIAIPREPISSRVGRTK